MDSQTQQRLRAVFGWRDLVLGRDRRIGLFIICTGAGVGTSPLAPGTAGTLLAWATVLSLPNLRTGVWLAAGAIAWLVGRWAVAAVQRLGGGDDPGWIVIDEIAAYWLLVGVVGTDALSTTASFALFRFFDVAKPPPIRALERRVEGAWGVMVDDLVAAAYAAGVIAVARVLL